VSDYPFLSAFFHILDVFVAMGGFDIESGTPLEEQEEGLPISPDLRSLNDLATKLLKYTIPAPGRPLEVDCMIKEIYLVL